LFTYYSVHFYAISWQKFGIEKQRRTLAEPLGVATSGNEANKPLEHHETY